MTQPAPTMAVNIVIGGGATVEPVAAEAPARRAGPLKRAVQDLREPGRYWLILTLSIALNNLACEALHVNVLGSLFIYAISFALFIACAGRSKPKE